MIFPEELSEGQPKITFLKDREWSYIDGEICKIHDFIPMAEIRNDRIISMSITMPYASIHFECRKIQGIATGFITHKIDFRHLWIAFKERTIQWNEEVLFIWTKKNYKIKLFTKPLPRMWVLVCPKGAYELHDPSFRPELYGEARWKAEAPIEEWKPEVMK